MTTTTCIAKFLGAPVAQTHAHFSASAALMHCRHYDSAWSVPASDPCIIQ